MDESESIQNVCTELRLLLYRKCCGAEGNMRSSTNPVLPAVQQRRLNREKRRTFQIKYRVKVEKNCKKGGHDRGKNERGDLNSG